MTHKSLGKPNHTVIPLRPLFEASNRFKVLGGPAIVGRKTFRSEKAHAPTAFDLELRRLESSRACST